MTRAVAFYRAYSRLSLAIGLQYRVALLLGRLSPSAALVGFATQLAWAAAALALFSVI